MENVTQEVLNLLSTLIEPKLKWNIISLNLLKKLVIEKNELLLEIHLVTHNSEQIEEFRHQCLEVLRPLGFDQIHLDIKRVGIAVQGISGVRNIILVASGKGGVGKSTVAVNLAAALSRQGFKTGLMDADIYGPSIPTMLGIIHKPQVLPDEYLLPVEAHGIKAMSIGLLVPPEKSISWRGQMVSGTLIQFIQKTFWGKLDYLIIDLPPGTGDIQLTLAHKIRSQGVVIVSTPQEVALGDVRRAINSYHEHEIPIIAVVENMSGLICEQCGHANNPFVASSSGLQVDLASGFQLPLHMEISKSGDAGIPLVISQPEHEISRIFTKLALQISKLLQPENESLAS